MRIAIVEDDPDIRSLLAIMISQKLGYPPPAVFNDGTSLVRAMANENLRFDVVIMDYRMPEMNGIEAAKIIKRHRAGTKIILATGYDVREEARQAGLLYLQKPFSIDSLAKILGQERTTRS
jgi:DNA-binding NtrC family response regulator